MKKTGGRRGKSILLPSQTWVTAFANCAGTLRLKCWLGTLHKAQLSRSARQERTAQAWTKACDSPRVGLWIEARFRSPPPLSHSLVLGAYDLRNSSGSLARLLLSFSPLLVCGLNQWIGNILTFAVV
jgi:hypothetical protein